MIAVGDIRAGDLIRLKHKSWDEPITGRVWASGGRLRIGGIDLAAWAEQWLLDVLEVLARAPRPVYVNHDREKPVPGDVARDADSDDAKVWMFTDPADPPEAWTMAFDGFWCSRAGLPDRLRLLVDGETGQVVP